MEEMYVYHYHATVNKSSGTAAQGNKIYPYPDVVIHGIIRATTPIDDSERYAYIRQFIIVQHLQHLPDKFAVNDVTFTSLTFLQRSPRKPEEM